MNNLGERLYNLRISHEMSQGDLAEKLDVSRQTISKWENNMSIPELDKIIALSELFCVTVDYIVKGEGEAPEIKSAQIAEEEFHPVAEATPVSMITVDPTKKLISGLSIGLGALYLITLLINSVSMISNIINGVAVSTYVSVLVSFALSYFACIALISKKLNLLAVYYILVAIYAATVNLIYGDTSNIIASVLNVIDYVIIVVLYYAGNKKNAKILSIVAVTLIVASFISDALGYAMLFSDEYNMALRNIIYSVFSSLIGKIPYLIVNIGTVVLLYLRANPKSVYEIPANQYPEHSDMYVGMVKHILLSLFTFGIYNCIWTYKTTENLNCGDNQIQSGTKKLLLCIFVPFYRLYWYYNQSKRLENLMKAKEEHTSDFALVTLILAIFVPIVAASAFLQLKVNEYTQK